MERKNIFSIDQDLLSLYLNNRDTNSQFGDSNFHDDESDKDFHLRYGFSN